MAVNTNFSIPFIPQTGVTEQILAAITAANEQHNQRQRIQLAQQAQQSTSQLQQQQALEAGARAGYYGSEQQKNQTQIDQMKRNQELFSQTVPQNTPTSSGAQLPSTTPLHLASMVGGMIPQNLTKDEQSILEASSAAGSAKARQIGGSDANYLEEMRLGVKQITDARAAQQKPQGQRQLGLDEANARTQGMMASWNKINPGQPFLDAFKVRPGMTEQDAAAREAIFDRLVKSSEVQASQQATAADRAQGRQMQRESLDLREQQAAEKKEKPTADEQRRADLGNNMLENLNQLEGIVDRRPDLFGPVAGRLTGAKMAIGTADKDVASLKAIHEYLGMASVGAHAMRNAQHVETAANAVADFHNEPQAIKAAIGEARKSVQTFLNDASPNRGKTDNDPLKIRPGTQ